MVLKSAGRWSDVFRLAPPAEAFLGRASSNQIVIRSHQASRQHARIYWSAPVAAGAAVDANAAVPADAATRADASTTSQPESTVTGSWVIEDLGSRNGTFVGGNEITAPHPLRDGDKIEIAGFAIQFTHTIHTGGIESTSDDDDAASQATDDQLTMEMNADAITDRRRHSDYLHGRGAAPESRSAETKTVADQNASGDDAPGVRSRLLKLAFTLARLDDSESAVAACLDDLVGSLKFDTAGVYLSERSTSPTSISEVPLVATRQSGDRSYRRPPEALLQNLVGESGHALLARNIVGDDQLATQNSRGEIDVESIILAPIRDHRDRFLGMIHMTTAAGIPPFDSDDLQVVVAVAEILAESVSRLADQRRLAKSLHLSRRKAELLQEQLGDKVRIVGKSEAIRAVIEKIKLAAPTHATVLVRGESGVGKELVAAALHHASNRREGPMVCLNCAALSETLLESELFGHEKGAFTGATERKRGKFEMADGGTLMLDEIGEMNGELQAKLLRVLEGHPFERVGGHEPIKVDVRVVAATNRDLQTMVGEGKFRQDLYYRLHVVEIIVPPLRQRQRDCLLLAQFFLDRFNREMGRRIETISEAAQKRLLQYHWPGNIRELRNVIERAVVLNQKNFIDENDLALSPTGSAGGANAAGSETAVEMTLAELEQQHIERVLRHTDGNKSRAAAMLGIERSTLDRKLKRFAAP
ncbi:two component, sigma54 specific, transcriptional regulator, Fis family [Rhodopirellula maiorica SM1]|uniref:Two component, sigma54 specific, transcriptional regulator, Fis family n=1 Tax=Rhodopirellula maiorica SM1 TaxID=1265738 RepID=M5R6Z9_9BACT|nr:two component, sigma54 specific, transcriptional regulator, Fis family [Rhodopirellula maiorica SM1]